MPRVLLETAVETVDAARAAERAGAARLELCVDLEAGGTTPPRALTRAVAAAVSIPVFAMIRPRGGSFVYTAAEIQLMHRQIDEALADGAAGLVLGALRADGEIDAAPTRDLARRARGRPVTFHRAFDATPDLLAGLDALADAGIARVLTSGGAPTAAEGASRIAALVAAAGSRLTVLAGGGIRAHNVASIVAASGVCEVHMRFEDEARTRQVVDLL